MSKNKTNIKAVLQEQDSEKYPGLHGFDYGRRWLDGFISIIEAYLLSMSSILLTVAGGMSMFAFLTGGLSFQPGSQALAFWALIQTVAVDMQFSVMWYKAAQSWRSKKFFPAIGYAFLGCILSVVLFEAYAVPSMESSMQRDFQATMSELGFDPKMMVFIRSGVAIMLMVVGATNRTFFIFSRDGKAQHIGGENHAQLALMSETQEEEISSEPVAILPTKQPKKARFALPHWGRKKSKKEEKNGLTPAKNEQDENEKIESAGGSALATLAKSELKNEQVAQSQVNQINEQDGKVESEISLSTSQSETHVPARVEEEIKVPARVEEEIKQILKSAQQAGSSDVLAGSEQSEPQTNPPTAPVQDGSIWERFSQLEPQTNPTGTYQEPTPIYGQGSFSNSFYAYAGASSAYRAPVNDARETPSGEFPSVPRGLIGMSLEELYEYEPLKQAFLRKDTRKNAIDAAYQSGKLRRKRDNSVTKNAVTEWLRTIQK